MLAAEANTFCGPFAGGSLLYMSLKNYLWRAVVYSYDTKPRRLRRFTDNRCLIGKRQRDFSCRSWPRDRGNLPSHCPEGRATQYL